MKLVMTKYKNFGGNSNIDSYEIGVDYIIIKFKGNYRHKYYKYTYASADKPRIEEMKMLAQKGQGLNSYINLYVRDDYETKW